MCTADNTGVSDPSMLYPYREMGGLQIRMERHNFNMIGNGKTLELIYHLPIELLVYNKRGLI